MKVVQSSLPYTGCLLTLGPGLHPRGCVDSVTKEAVPWHAVTHNTSNNGTRMDASHDLNCSVAHVWAVNYLDMNCFLPNIGYSNIVGIIFLEV